MTSSKTENFIVELSLQFIGISTLDRSQCDPLKLWSYSIMGSMLSYTLLRILMYISAHVLENRIRDVVRRIASDFNYFASIVLYLDLMRRSDGLKNANSNAYKIRRMGKRSWIIVSVLSVWWCFTAILSIVETVHIPQTRNTEMYFQKWQLFLYMLIFYMENILVNSIVVISATWTTNSILTMRHNLQTFRQRLKELARYMLNNDSESINVIERLQREYYTAVKQQADTLAEFGTTSAALLVSYAATTLEISCQLAYVDVWNEDHFYNLAPQVRIVALILLLIILCDTSSQCTLLSSKIEDTFFEWLQRSPTQNETTFQRCTMFLNQIRSSSVNLKAGNVINLGRQTIVFLALFTTATIFALTHNLW